MAERKKTPWGVLLVLLSIAFIGAYYISALFLVEDLKITNLEEHMLQILRNPFKWYWNEKTLSCIGVALLAWIMFVGWYTYNYRNFQYDNEYGSEDWGDPKNLSKRLKGKNPNNMRILSENVSVSKEADVLSNNNMIVLAAPGQYKTTAMVELNMSTLSAAYIMLDVKGATQRKMGNYFLAHNYTVRSLNLKEPWLSDRYNPFRYIERENDLIRLITNLQESVRKPDSGAGSDPFWDDGVRMYLQALFYAEWLSAREKGTYGNMNNILKLVNMEVQKTNDENTSKLQVYMDKLAAKKGDTYPPVREYRKLKEGASETVRSIVIMVNAMLSLCETADVQRIFSEDDMNIRELGTGVDGNPNKKVVLFLILPDNDKSYNFLINIFYTQMFDILMRLADDEIKAPLPVPVEVWADEVYAGPKPVDMESLMGVIRSRNISLIPIFQSIAQAQTLYKDHKWKILFDNAATFAFYGSAPGAKETHEYISSLLGKMSVDMHTDGRSRGRNASANDTFNRGGRELMFPAEVRRMSRKDCILFIEGERPIFDQKYLPFNTNLYKEFKRLGPYEHPVKVIYNEEKMQYRTIERKEQLQVLSNEDAQFYKEAAKKDERIKIFDIDETEMLYLNWHEQKELNEEEIARLAKVALEREQARDGGIEEDIPEDVKILKEPTDISTQDKSKWNLKGSILDCVVRYASLLSEQEIDEIIAGLEAGLTEKEVKAYFSKPLPKMEQYRRAYMLKHRA